MGQMDFSVQKQICKYVRIHVYYSTQRAKGWITSQQIIRFVDFLGEENLEKTYIKFFFILGPTSSSSGKKKNVNVFMCKGIPPKSFIWFIYIQFCTLKQHKLCNQSNQWLINTQQTVMFINIEYRKESE